MAARHLATRSGRSDNQAFRPSSNVSRLAPRMGLMRHAAAGALRRLALKTASHCIEGVRIQVGKRLLNPCANQLPARQP